MNKDEQHIIETRDVGVYLLPHKTFLQVRGRLQTDANANYAYVDVITRNGWSLFQSARYQINDKTIEDVNDYLPYVSMWKNEYNRVIM